MPRVYISTSLKPHRKHDPEELKKAVEKVKNGVLTLRKAGMEYGIPYSVIYRHLKKGDRMKLPGGQTCLSETEEKVLVERLKICAEWGYPIDTLTLRVIVKDFLDRKRRQVTKFKNNFPGKEFVFSFLKRHRKDLSYRMCQNIKRNRAAVSSEIINEYIDKLQVELQNVVPQNIVNCDETNLCDDPGKKKVITRRGCKYPERVMNSTKASTSVMFSAAGDGTILPPYIVYKAIHLYSSWTENGPKCARYNRTKSGWFDSFCFEDWILTVAIPYFKKLSGKKVLIGDNLASHLTTEAIRMCSENDIHMIFLPANSTHITQPLDVAFFRPMKIAWRQILEQWKSSLGRNEATVPKDKFPRLLNQLMVKIADKGTGNIRAGFKKCGIVPLDREPVLGMLPQTVDSRENQERVTMDETIVEVLKSMRYEEAGKPMRQKRSKLNVVPGKSVGSLDESSSSESSDSISLHNSDSDIDPPSELDDITEEETPYINQNRPTTKHQFQVSTTKPAPFSSINSISGNTSASYPLKVKAEEIQEEDWLIVNFFFQYQQDS